MNFEDAKNRVQFRFKMDFQTSILVITSFLISMTSLTHALSTQDIQLKLKQTIEQAKQDFPNRLNDPNQPAPSLESALETA